MKLNKKFFKIFVSIIFFFPLIFILAAFFITKYVDDKIIKYEILKEEGWTIEGKFDKNGNYQGSHAGVYLDTEGFILWGSHMGSDLNTGQLISPVYTAAPWMAIFYTGRPNMDNISLQIKNLNTNQLKDIEIPLIDPGDCWKMLELRVPKSWYNSKMQIITTDNSKEFGGWVGISSPFKLIRPWFVNLLIEYIVEPVKYSSKKNILLSVLGLYFFLYLLALYPQKTGSFFLKGNFVVFTGIVLFLLIYGFFLDPLSKYVMLFNIIIELLIFQFLLITPGFFFLLLISKRHFNNNFAFLLSIPTTIAIFCLTFIILYCFKSPPVIYLIVNSSILILLFFIAYRKKFILQLINIKKLYIYASIVILISCLIAASFVAVNFDNPRDISHWGSASGRGFVELAVDNNLQLQAAEVFSDYKEPWADEQWTMGDRPPLVGVLFSIIILTFFKPLNLAYSFWDYQLFGILLNSLFFLPLTIIMQKIFKNHKTVYLIPTAVFLNIFIFINIYFTWTRLVGVYFVLVTIVILWKKRKIKILDMIIAAALMAFGALSHGHVFLCIPIFFILYSIIAFKKLRFRYIIHIIVFFTFFFLFQLPWFYYKKAHPIIDTNKLVYHYLPTEKQPKVFTTKNIIKSAVSFFRTYSLEKQVKQRLKNLKEATNMKKFVNALEPIISGNWIEYRSPLWGRHMGHPFSALGEIQIVTSISILIIFFIKFLIKRENFSLPFNKKYLIFFLSFVVLSYLFNILLKWANVRSRDLPFVEPVLGLTILLGISLSYSKIINIFLFGIICIQFFNYILSSSVYHKYHLFDFFNIVIAFGVVGLIYLAIKFSKWETA